MVHKRLSMILSFIIFLACLASCGKENSSAEDASSAISVESDTVSSESTVLKHNVPDPLEVGFTKYDNPFAEYAADPSIVKHNGKYYYCFSAWGSFFISCFDSLGEITTDGAVLALDFSKVPEYAHNAWAPELHYIDGYWYIYYAGCDETAENRRMYVAKSKTDDPMSEYEFVGQITDSTNKWAIDGSVFKYKDKMYFIWSGWEGDENVAQNIYIAEMSSPTTLSSERVCLSEPIEKWEGKGGTPNVNEGPVALVSGDYLSIIYSASGSWCDDYCLGQLLFNGGDIMDPDNWKKHSEPILKKNADYFYGPGHNCIVADENGVLWFVFHANKEPGKGWDGRSGWLYPIRINENGIVEVVLYK